MATIDKTLPYEVLIRFGEDGLVKGGHYQDRRIVEIDGERVMDQPGAAKPLGSSPEEVKALLPGAALTALSEIDRLNALAAETQAAHEQALEAVRSELQAVRDELANAQATIAALTAPAEAA